MSLLIDGLILLYYYGVIVYVEMAPIMALKVYILSLMDCMIDDPVCQSKLYYQFKFDGVLTYLCKIAGQRQKHG